MIEALIAGETDPNALAALAHRRIKASPAELEAALRGRVTDHHRFMLRLLLQHIDAIEATITQIDQEVDVQVEPFRTAVQLLTTIPGISELSACVILAEIGRDMSRFPTAGHLISWAGLCPKNDESPTGHVWMAPGSQGFFGVPASKANCGHVSGLVARREAAGPDGFRGIEALIKPAGSRCPMTRDRYP